MRRHLGQRQDVVRIPRYRSHGGPDNRVRKGRLLRGEFCMRSADIFFDRGQDGFQASSMRRYFCSDSPALASIPWHGAATALIHVCEQPCSDGQCLGFSGEAGRACWLSRQGP
jgi:hypothetical protein